MRQVYVYACEAFGSLYYSAAMADLKVRGDEPTSITLAEAVVVYNDAGGTPLKLFQTARARGLPIEQRSLTPAAVGAPYGTDLWKVLKSREAEGERTLKRLADTINGRLKDLGLQSTVQVVRATPLQVNITLADPDDALNKITPVCRDVLAFTKDLYFMLSP